jgi:hypothetical protein
MAAEIPAPYRLFNFAALQRNVNVERRPAGNLFYLPGPERQL